VGKPFTRGIAVYSGSEATLFLGTEISENTIFREFSKLLLQKIRCNSSGTRKTLTTHTLSFLEVTAGRTYGTRNVEK
jgi:hypothetical protein